MRWHQGPWFALAILFFQGDPSPAHAQGAITPYFGEHTLHTRRQVLFIRRNPIVLAAFDFEQPVRNYIGMIVRIYARAASLPLSSSNEGVNFAFVRLDRITRDGKIGSAALVEMGFPSEIAAELSRRHTERRDCSAHNFHDHAGSISHTIVLIDQDLDKNSTMKCIQHAVTRAFGFGEGAKKDLPSELNIFKYTYALSVVSRCDRENAASAIEAVKNCIEKEASELTIVQKPVFQ